MNESLWFSAVEVYEWYDGLVLGLSHAGDSVFLTCLLAFEPDAQKKRYLLASLSQAQTKLLGSLFQEGKLKAFDSQILSKVIHDSENIYLTSIEPENSKTIVLTRMNSDQKVQLPDLSFPLIDKAVSAEAIAQWLGD